MVEVEPPPPPPLAAAGPVARGLKPRRVSAKRTWPPGCGRFPPPPLPPAIDAGDRGPDGVVEGNEAGLVVPVAASSAPCNGSVPHPLPLPAAEGETEVRGENGEAKLLDVEEADRVADGRAAVAAPESFGVVVVNGVMDNGREAANTGVEENGDGGGGELERRWGGGDGGDRKRWLVSVMHPPPKRRAVSAKRSFPPGCGRPAPAPLVGSRGEEDGLQLEAMPAADGDAPVADVRPGAPVVMRVSREGASSLILGKDASNGKPDGKRLEDMGDSNTDREIVAGDIVPDDSAGGKHGSILKPNFVAETSAKRVSYEKTNRKILEHKVKSAANEAEEDDKVRSKFEGRLGTAVAQTSAGVSSYKKMKWKRVLESDEISRAPPDVAVGASEDGKMTSSPSSMKKLSVLTHREAEHSHIKVASTKKLAPKPNSNDTKNPVAKILRKSVNEDMEEAEFGRRVNTNQNGEVDALDVLTDKLIVQALMSPDKCPWTQGRKSIASVSHSLTSKKIKKQDTAQRKQLSKKVAHPSKLISKEKLDEDEASSCGNGSSSKALVVHEGKHKLCINFPPCVPSNGQHKQSRDQDVDARSKVRRMLKLFQLICRKLVQAEEQRSFKVSRIDLEADKIIRGSPEFTKSGPIVGHVPGVEVGDEFHYRVELSIVGLHRPFQAGIDSTKDNGVLVATSIVASGGYPDELSSSNELIYTGSGGKAAGKKEAEDQKLERGNLALKNCIETKTPVRVIHGFKGQSREAGNSRVKQTSTFTYDGLYMVVACWQEGPKGSMVFKYKLRRIPGQPELSLHIVKETKKSKERKGLRLPDISEGKEGNPICVINTFDDMLPAPFKYITKIIYPPWYAKQRPQGCDCTNGCSDSARCACAVKNGGEIPFNFNGAIVHAKPLIYECGPSCRCLPTCHNRVSQHGVKIPLEIFRTSKTGWGVRSLSSISSGSFICEYVGELLQDKEAEKRSNDEYLFDIGHNYDDEDLWKGLPSIIPGLQTSNSCSETMEDMGFTIDAAKCGNIGRFINHSCSPNLYAQNVLWDHDDKRMPHIMFFAAENIPPLQELTYHYNYTIGQVHDENGEEKVKHCYCGSPECCGRMY